MPTNDFLPVATAGGANVMSQSDYLAEAARIAGVTAGTAKSALANKSWRQSASVAAMVGQFMNDYGALDALDDGNISNLVRDFARSLQRGTFLLGVATGTANAWTLTPVPSLAAYAAGRPALVTIPATNTSTTVNANVSGLGNRRVKKSDGTDPAIGDLVSGQMIWCADDGTNIRVLSLLASDLLNLVLAPPVADKVGLRKVQAFLASTTWTVPAGVYGILVEGWGAGGGGGSGNGTAQSGGGGAGGSYFARFYAVTPGNSVSITVGLAAAAPAVGNPGNSGGTTSVTVNAVTCTAPGGGGGQSGGGGALGGAPGNASGGDENITGGQGGNYFSASIGGRGGESPRGGSGSGAGSNGNFPGGGGGGGAPTLAGRIGGDGQVKITY